MNNQKCNSCIPQGIYKAKAYSSKKYPNVVEIQDVPHRDKILIHKGNYHWDIKGCILLGSSYKEEVIAYNRSIKKKEKTGAVYDSKKTIKNFYEKATYEFDLEIIDLVNDSQYQQQCVIYDLNFPTIYHLCQGQV